MGQRAGLRVRSKTMSASLVLIVEVEWDERIRCQAPGCGKAVYKRIHVVRESERVVVVGSDCWARIYAGLPGTNSKPQHGAAQGRKLSSEERAFLVANTAAFIAQIEQEALGAAAIAYDARARRERENRETSQRQQLRWQAPPFDPDDPPYIAPEGRWLQRQNPREALQKWREQEARRVARETLARAPAFQLFPERWIARAMMRAKEDLVAEGLKLAEAGSRQRIEDRALDLLRRHYRPASG
jgi:hypothetical protein